MIFVIAVGYANSCLLTSRSISNAAPQLQEGANLPREELVREIEKAKTVWSKAHSSFRGFQIDFTWDYKTDDESTGASKNRFAVTMGGNLFHEDGIGSDSRAKDRRVINEKYEFMVGGLNSGGAARLLSGAKTTTGTERLRSSMNNRIAAVGCPWHIYFYPASEIVDLAGDALSGSVIVSGVKETLRLECRFPNGLKFQKKPCMLWAEMDRAGYRIERSGIVYEKSNITDEITSNHQSTDYGWLAKTWTQIGRVGGKVSDTTIQEFDSPVPCQIPEEEALLGHYGISESALDERKARPVGYYVLGAAVLLCVVGFLVRRLEKRRAKD
jgi:hypothetical protein